MLTPREWVIEEPSCTTTDTAQVGATVNSNVKVNSFVSEARLIDPDEQWSETYYLLGDVVTTNGQDLMADLSDCVGNDFNALALFVATINSHLTTTEALLTKVACDPMHAIQ